MPDPGSSPRVRGTRRAVLAEVLVERFIPACAGNSPAARRPHPWPPVHPRVCGELLRDQGGGDPSRGSSPRVRGTPPHLVVHLSGVRFIPACAGNSRRGLDDGEYRDRFIPACAGNSVANGITGGETYGSSPRVRGTLGIAAGLAVRARFIPACAGNSRAAFARRSMSTVHPRVCGELGSIGVTDNRKLHILDNRKLHSERTAGEEPVHHAGRKDAWEMRCTGWRRGCC